jgi:aminoglycoside 6-adenylyltransferase
MAHTDHEVDVLARLVRLAERNELVRALLLERSRATGAALDAFSDYDVLLVVSDPRPFTESDTWLAGFAPPLVMVRDAMRTWEAETYTRLVLYEDGTKVDYAIWPVALLRQVAERQTLPNLLDWG